MALPRIGFALLVVLGPCALAERNMMSSIAIGEDGVEEEGPGADSVRTMFENENNAICGGHVIRKELKGDGSESDARRINWKKVISVADEYLRTQKQKVSFLKDESARLQGLIDSHAGGAPPSLEMPVIQKLVEDALTEGYAHAKNDADGGLGLAKKTHCGNIRSRPRASSAMYTAAIEAFEKVVAAKLKEVKFQLTKKELSDTCLVIWPELATQEGKEGSNCDELCVQFGNAGKTLTTSSDTAGAKIAVGKDALISQKNTNDVKLQEEEGEHTECEEAKLSLDTFRAEIETLDNIIKDLFAAYNLALSDNSVATARLQDLSLKVANQAKVTEQAADLAKSLGAQAATLATALGQLKESGVRNTKDLEAAEANLKKSFADLSVAEKASEQERGLKKDVAKVILGMWLSIDAAVRTPLTSLGLDMKLDIDGSLPLISQSCDQFEVLKNTMTELNGFCNTNEAMKAYDSMAPTKKLAPLCEFGSAGKGGGLKPAEMFETVNKRIQYVKKSITNAKSWTNKYKGQPKMNDQVVAQYVAQGEPEKLREIMGLLQKSKFYSNYLKKWKVGGEFLQLEADLKAAVAQLTDKHKAMEAALKKVQGQIKDDTAKQNKLDASLAKLKIQDAGAKSILKDLQEKLNDMKAEQAEMTKLIADLNDAVARALASYLQAKEALGEAYRSGTNLVEFFAELAE